MKDNIRIPGTPVKVTSKSQLHEGVTGIVVQDYDMTILIKVDDETHKYAYRSRVGKNDDGLDPRAFLDGKFIMAFPHAVLETAKRK